MRAIFDASKGQHKLYEAPAKILKHNALNTTSLKTLKNNVEVVRAVEPHCAGIAAIPVATDAAERSRFAGSAPSKAAAAPGARAPGPGPCKVYVYVCIVYQYMYMCMYRSSFF